MLRNYLSAALRNLWRNRAYAAINLIGLVVGFVAAILIALYVRDEYSYDRFWPDYQRIFKIDEVLSYPGRAPINGSQTVSDMAQMLKLDFPQIEQTTRLVRSGAPTVLRRGGISGSVVPADWVDSDFFDFFPVRTIAGSLAKALSRPDGIVLTRKVARRFFGRDDVVGETVELNREHIMHVTAVIEDLPSNTSLTGDAFLPGIASFSDLSQQDAITRGTGTIKAFSVYTYVRLRAGAKVEPINAALGSFVSRHFPEEDDGAPLSKALRIRLSPMASAHLQPRQIDAMKPQADPRTLHIMIGVAILILFVAASNFVSMMTARSFHRAVEVGVRKAVGATRREIVVQFVGECLLYASVALAVAVAAVDLFLPAMNGFLQRDIAFTYFRDRVLGAGLLALAVVVGLAASVYPSLVLSNVRPSIVLKGGGAIPGVSGRFRQALVVFQFATLIALIVVTMTIDRQARYALEERLRVPSDQIYMRTGGCPRGFADAAARLPGVLAVSCASSAATAQSHWGAAFSSPHGGNLVSIESGMIDYGYFNVFNIRPIAGRLLAQDRGEDDILRGGDAIPENPSIVLNESAVRALAFESAQAAVGQYVRWSRPEIVHGSGATTDAMYSQIVGVVPDFSLGSIRDVIEATAYYVDPALSNYDLLLKLDGRTIPETVRALNELWVRQAQPDPFEGVFLSQFFQDLYSDIDQQAQLFSGFSSIAVVIAALGLLGLAVFTAARRTKEVALRKVMGASRLDILRFLGWQFASPVVSANLIAWPCAYFLLHRWLEGFAYHVDLSPLTFLVAGALALIIALATVAGHALLVARAKPVEALRYE